MLNHYGSVGAHKWNSKTCKAPVKSPPQPTIPTPKKVHYRPDAPAAAQPTMSLSLRHVTWSKSSRCHKHFKYYYSLAHGSTYVHQLCRAQSSNLLVLANIWAPFDTSVVVSVASVTAFSHFNYIKSILYGCPIMQFTCLQQAQRMHLPQIQHSSHAVTFLSTARTSICSQ